MWNMFNSNQGLGITDKPYAVGALSNTISSPKFGINGSSSAGALMGAGSALSAPVGFGSELGGKVDFKTSAESGGSLFNSGDSGTLGSGGGSDISKNPLTLNKTLDILNTASGLFGKSQEQEQQQMIQASPVRVRGVQFDSKLFENKELTKAYNKLYYGPSNT